MYIVKVLKRKDAASVIVGIVLAMALSNLILPYSFELTNKILPTDGFQSTQGWEDVYLGPIINLFIQVILLEVILRIVVFVRDGLVRRVK